MDAPTPIIRSVLPSFGIPGGELTIECEKFVPGLPSSSRVLFGNSEAMIISASEDRVVVRIPEDARALGITLQVGDARSPVFPFVTAIRLATGLHPVANPVIAPDGTVISTVSGSLGESVGHSLIRITLAGEKIPFPCEIVNPTGLAFGGDGQLYVSSRSEGVVFRYTDFEELEVVAEDLGVACGIAFDARGRLYVGDRSGNIYRLDDSGSKEEFARLKPSVSAYHLAFDATDRLYVTGPTFSTRDELSRITPEGQVEVILDGLARPQGMAFTENGELLITACYQGKKGVFKFSPKTKEIIHFIAAPAMVGIAYSRDDLFLVDNSSVFRLNCRAVH